MCAAAARSTAGKEAVMNAEHGEAEAWSIRMECYGDPRSRSETIGQCLKLARAGWRSSATLQSAGKPAAQRHPLTTRYAALQVGGIAEVPILLEGALRTPRRRATP